MPNDDKRLIVALDVDGVLADFVGGFCKLSREMFGVPLEDYVQTKWNFEDDSSGLNTEQVDAMWERIKATENWWLTLQPLERISLDMHNCPDMRFYFVTARIPTAGLPVETQTAAWLSRECGIFSPDVITVPPSKKAAVLKALRVDAFIDDKPETIRQCRVAGLSAWVRAAGYNKGLEVPRCYSVRDFLQNVRDYVRR